MGRIPPGFTASGFPFMGPYVEHHAEPRDYPGLWHVTTGAPGVVREGRLLSRRELRQLDRRFAGLGGGPMDVAPATVSAVTRPEDALRLLRAMQRAALAARDRIPAWRVAWETMQDSHWTDLLWEADRALEGLFGWGEPEDERDPAGETLEAEVEGVGQCMDEVWGGGWPKDRAQARKRAAYMEARWRLGRAGEGESRFHLIQAIETCANQLWAAIPDETILADAMLGPVGFTEQQGWHKIDPRNIRVLRLAAREEARPDHVAQEGELRFKPEDLVVLGVESLRGLVRLSEAPQRLRLGRGSRDVAAAFLTTVDVQTRACWEHPQRSRGRCVLAAHAFEQFLRSRDERATILRARGWRGGGSRAADPPLWESEWVLHAVVLWRDEVWDWTARQFDSGAPFPERLSPAAFQARWLRVEPVEGW